MKARGYLFATIAAITYGLIPLFILPIKASHFSMNVTLFYRFFVSALLLLILLFFRKENLSISGKEFGVYATLGVLFALSSDFLFQAYDYLSAGIASCILFVYPVIVALMMSIFFGEKISRMTALSLIISLFGIYLLSTRDSFFMINYKGLFIAVMSALCYAAYIVIVNKARLKGSGIKATFYSLLFSSIFYFLKSIFLGESLALPNLKLLFDITLFGLITSVISITTLIYAIKIIGSTPTSILGALEPVVAVVVSVLFFNEKITTIIILGIFLIIAGVLINIICDNKKAPTKELQEKNA